MIMMWQFINVFRNMSAKAWLFVIGAAISVVLSFVAYDWVYSRGYDAAEREFDARVEQELSRQARANEAALADAFERIEQLKLAKEVRDATIERLNEEALADVDADRRALGAASVQRLNAVRD